MKVMGSPGWDGLENNTTLKKQLVLNVLHKLSNNNCSDPTRWPTTRAIADACDDSIFVIRYWLGLLEKEGAIVSLTTNGSSGGRGNPLRWSLKSGDRNTDATQNGWEADISKIAGDR